MKRARPWWFLPAVGCVIIVGASEIITTIVIINRRDSNGLSIETNAFAAGAFVLTLLAATAALATYALATRKPSPTVLIKTPGYPAITAQEGQRLTLILDPPVPGKLFRSVRREALISPAISLWIKNHKGAAPARSLTVLLAFTGIVGIRGENWLSVATTQATAAFEWNGGINHVVPPSGTLSLPLLDLARARVIDRANLKLIITLFADWFDSRPISMSIATVEG